QAHAAAGRDGRWQTLLGRQAALAVRRRRAIVVHRQEDEDGDADELQRRREHRERRLRRLPRRERRQDRAQAVEQQRRPRDGARAQDGRARRQDRPDRVRQADEMRAAVAAVIVCAAQVAHAQPAQLRTDELYGAIESEPPTIELVTFGVGERIFEIFGHTAICLRYHEPAHEPVCFNYGVTNFDAGGEMVWGFLRRTHRFWVEPTSFESMFDFYRWEDRDIWVQTLPIVGARARALEAKLWSDIQEANRYYYYDHFVDNCATRVRDLIDDATGGGLRAGSDARYPLSFRELGRRGLARSPLLMAVSDLVAGRELDEH